VAILAMSNVYMLSTTMISHTDSVNVNFISKCFKAFQITTWSNHFSL